MNTRSILGLLCVQLLFFSTVADARTMVDSDRQALVTVRNYRHRFEHSTHLKQLRWTLEHRYNKAYCDFCDLVVPVARTLIDVNQTEHIENVITGFCREFKLIDLDVCMGAVHEYKVSGATHGTLFPRAFSIRTPSLKSSHCRVTTINNCVHWPLIAINNPTIPFSLGTSRYRRINRNHRLGLHSHLP